MNSEVAKKINELRNDRLHGAGWLSRQAISALNLAINESQAETITDFTDEIRIVAAELVKARPSMISIANYIHQFLHQLMLEAQKETNLDSLRGLAETRGNELIESSERAALQASSYGRQENEVLRMPIAPYCIGTHELTLHSLARLPV